MPGKTAETLVGQDMARTLSGFCPQLVLDLAQLQGSTLEDVQVTLQLAPFGDRTVLIAYGCARRDSKHNRRFIAEPKLLDVIDAAHAIVMHLALQRVRPTDVADFLPAPTAGLVQ